MLCLPVGHRARFAVLGLAVGPRERLLCLTVQYVKPAILDPIARFEA